jgi:hypothetical protein
MKRLSIVGVSGLLNYLTIEVYTFVVHLIVMRRLDFLVIT